MAKRIILRSIAVTVAVTTLFALTVGAVLISLVVGDWIILRTENTGLAWTMGTIVLLYYLITLGAGIGVYLWLRAPKTDSDIRSVHNTMDTLLTTVQHDSRDD